MPITTGQFVTPNASKYLQQLCKHFAHKAEVSYDHEFGEIVLPYGRVTLHANSDALTADISVEAEDMIERGRMFIDSHLERFAFREEFKTMNWNE